MVLDCPGAGQPAWPRDTGGFSRRLIRTDMIGGCWSGPSNWPGRTEAFDGRSAENLRVAIDSSPLEGAGRVEDTINCSATPPARSFCVWLTCWLDGG